MRLTRLYMPEKEFAAKQTIGLNPDQSHYLLRVLRLENGAPVALFNGQAGTWQGSLTVVGKKAAVVLGKQIQTPQPVNDIWLLISPLKKEAWDFALEKATELGVGAIRPILMEYTQNARINDERARANLVEAAQQSERTQPPEYLTYLMLEKLVNTWDDKRILYVALERSDAKPAGEVFAADKGKKAAILIGPEGGFSSKEREMLLSKPFVKPISLGPTVLRAETAAIAALSVYLL